MVKINELKATIKRLKKLGCAEYEAEKLAKQRLIFIDKEFTSKDLYIDMGYERAYVIPKVSIYEKPIKIVFEGDLISEA